MKKKEYVIIDKSRVMNEFETLSGTGKNGKFNQTDFSKVANISSVSRYLGTPTQKKDLDHIEAFIDYVYKCTGDKIRIEYLIGEDDYRTEEDMFTGLDEDRYNNIRIALDYLRMVGFSVVAYKFTGTGGDLPPYCDIDRFKNEILKEDEDLFFAITKTTNTEEDQGEEDQGEEDQGEEPKLFTLDSLFDFFEKTEAAVHFVFDNFY